MVTAGLVVLSFAGWGLSVLLAFLLWVEARMHSAMVRVATHRQAGWARAEVRCDALARELRARDEGHQLGSCPQQRAADGVPNGRETTGDPPEAPALRPRAPRPSSMHPVQVLCTPCSARLTDIGGHWCTWRDDGPAQACSGCGTATCWRTQDLRVGA